MPKKGSKLNMPPILVAIHTISLGVHPNIDTLFITRSIGYLTAEQSSWRWLIVIEKAYYTSSSVSMKSCIIVSNRLPIRCVPLLSGCTLTRCLICTTALGIIGKAEETFSTGVTNVIQGHNTIIWVNFSTKKEIYTLSI